MARVTLALACAAALAGCGAEPPVETTLGGLVVRLESDPARLEIRAPDGTVLLDGVPGGDDGAYAPAAFRSAQATIESLFGAFRFDENNPEWHGTRRLTDIVAGADSVSFRLDGPEGGRGEVRVLGEGALRVVLTAEGATRASAAFRCAAGEHFIGFGAQTHDVDHRGQTVPIWVSEQGIGKVDSDDPPGDWFFRGTRHSSYFPVPFFISSRGYGVQADTSRRSVFAMCSERDDAWRVEAWEGELSLQVFHGPSPLEVIRRRSERIGRPAVPPAWAFAPWNDAVRGAAEVRRVAKLLRDNKIPSSALWTEDWAGGIQTGDNYNLTYDWTVDRALYPDVEQMISELHASGFKFLGYFNTFVEKDSDHFQEGIDKRYVIRRSDGTPYTFEGVRFTQTTLVDLSNPAAVDWMAAALSSALALGMDGWMADYAEWLPVDVALASGADAEAAHNLYPIEWQKLNARVLAANPEALSFVRSGFTGSPGIAQQVVWGGDQTTDFDSDDGLPTVIPIGIGLGVAGLPYYGSDIAGYFSGSGHPFVTEELFYRWAALGALTPIMRTHHGVASGKNWSFDRDAATIDHYRRWTRTHVQLYPYLAAAADQAARTGAPMVRALALGFPADAQAWPVKDQFLLGPSLLVAPVMTAGATARKVYLPAGRWLPVFATQNSAPLDGPATVEVAAPRTELPIFAPAGTVLVLLPATTETLARSTTGVPDLDAAQSREILALLGANGSAQEASASYTLTSASAPDVSATLTWNGAALVACDPTTPVAPCGAVTPSNREAQALTVGNGTLALGGSQLSVSSSRAHTLHIRW